MKKILIFGLSLSLLFSLCACKSGDTVSDTAPQSATVTVTDHAGNRVTVAKNAQRIAVCDIYPLVSVLAVFFDSADRIVGMPAQSMMPAKNGLLSQLYPEILNAETGYIDGTAVNTESLMALAPDVVFYSDGNKALGEQLRAAGLSAVAISASKWDYNAIETLDQWIALLSKIFPENDRTQTVKDYSRKVYDRVQDGIKGLTESEKQKIFFLFQYSDTAIATSGNRFFGQWWADSIGAYNAGAELSTDKSTAVTMEQIYAWDPDKILITNFNTAQPQDLYDNTVGAFDWHPVAAVKQRQVYKMPLGMYRSYTCGVDTPVTLLWMAKTVYPDRFADVDIIAETKQYYADVFGIMLTDAQAEMIFAP